MDIKSILSEENQLQNIITFPRGLPGFEDQTHFRLFREEGNEIVYWLQASDNEALTFSVAPPLYFNINYNFTLTDEEEALLQVKSPDDLLILIFLAKEEEQGNKPTIKGSFKSPVLINIAKRIGYQKVLADIEQNITLIEKIS